MELEVGRLWGCSQKMNGDSEQWTEWKMSPETVLTQGKSIYRFSKKEKESVNSHEGNNLVCLWKSWSECNLRHIRLRVEQILKYSYGEAIWLECLVPLYIGYSGISGGARCKVEDNTLELTPCRVFMKAFYCSSCLLDFSTLIYRKMWLFNSGFSTEF